jgi:hypothetical protein
MQMHLDFPVDDLAANEARGLAAGATRPVGYSYVAGAPSQ